MLNASKIKAVAGGFVAAGTIMTAVPTEAATIFQSFSMAVLNPDLSGNGSFDLNKFNAPSLGTLNFVKITLAPGVKTNIDNPNPTPGTALFTMRGYVNIASTDTNAHVFDNWEGINTSLQSTLNSSHFFSNTPPVITTTLTSASDLAKFIGTGSYHYNVQSGMEVLSSGGAPYGDVIDNRSRPYITVTYDFNEAVITPPSAVPEPATWAMMIAGFGLAGAAIRRRRHAANDSASAPASAQALTM